MYINDHIKFSSERENSNEETTIDFRVLVFSYFVASEQSLFSRGASYTAFLFSFQCFHCSTENLVKKKLPN